MGLDLTERSPELLQPLSDFDRENNLNLTSIINEGPEEKLKDTKYTQPAILFHSIIALQPLQNLIPVKPAFVAGHSLGEIRSPVTNGSLTPRAAPYLVHRRGDFMT